MNILGIINPGHGKIDPGAIAPTGQTEKATNLNVAKYAQAALLRSGISIVMTRTTDVSGTVAEVQAFIRKYPKSAFVLSIHHNGNIPGAKGAEVCCQVTKSNVTYDDKAIAWAKLVLKHIQELGQTLHDDGIIQKPLDSGQDYYGVLRTSAQLGIPAIIVEGAFMSAADVVDVDTAAEQRKLGEAIAQATCEWLGVKFVAA